MFYTHFLMYNVLKIFMASHLNNNNSMCAERVHCAVLWNAVLCSLVTPQLICRVTPRLMVEVVVFLCLVCFV